MCFGQAEAHHLNSYGSWNTWKVIGIYNFIFKAWKVMKLKCGSWKIIEKQIAKGSKVEKITERIDVNESNIHYF